MLAYMSYGVRLAEALALAKKDRKSLAAALGVSVQAVGQIINGKTVAATAENCARAARFLNVDMYWLATGEGEPRPAPMLSPMAFQIARDFDGRVPKDRRDAVYAQVMGTIDLASPAPPGASQILALPKSSPARQ